MNVMSKKLPLDKDVLNKSVVDDLNADKIAMLKSLTTDKNLEYLFYKSSIPKALSSIDSKKFIAVNRAWEEITGFKSDEVIGKDVYELNLVTPEVGKRINKVLVAENSLESFESEFINKKGDKAIASFSFEIISIENVDYVLSEIQNVSTLKSSVDLLSIEKEFSQRLVSSLKEGLSVVDVNGTHLMVNPALCNMTGFSEEELVGTGIPHKYWPPEEFGPIKKAFQKVLSGTLEKVDLVFVRKNGRRFPVELCASAIYDNYGNPVAYFSTVNDITQKIKAKAELKAAKYFSEQLISSLKYGLVIISTEGKIIDVNEAFCSITEFEREELIGMTTPFPFWHPKSVDKMQSVFDKTLTGISGSYELLYIRKSGETFNAALTTSRILDENGNILAFCATLEDITERIKSQTEIKLQKEFSENLLVSMREGLIVVSSESGKVTKVNPAFCEMTGYSEAELLSTQAPFPFWAPECYDTCYIHLEKLLQKEFQNTYETTYKRKNGDRFGVQLISSQIFDQDGNVVGILATIQDITERKRAEEELRMERDFSEELLLSLREGIIVVNIDGSAISVNPAFCNMTGFTQEELIGVGAPVPYYPPESYSVLEDSLKLAISGEVRDFEFNIMRKSGERFLVSVASSHVKDKNGKLVAVLATVQDISEARKAQRKLEDIAANSFLRKKVILELASLVGGDFDKSIKKITSSTAKTLGLHKVSIWKLNRDANELMCLNEFNQDTQSFKDGMVRYRKDEPDFFEIFSGSEIETQNNSEKRITTRKLIMDNTDPILHTSMMETLVQASNGHYGVLTFESFSENKEWTVDEEEFASSIASLVYLMVATSERKLAEQKLKALNDELSAAVGELKQLKIKLEDENFYLRNELDMVFNFEEMVYGSALFSQVLTDVENVASTDATVLLLGETGTGKELLARAIHNISNRKDEPLIKVNCAAIPTELIESELFGHKRGSFTGAISDKVGKVELAHGGTLFLDEIGELPIAMQPKLLRFLQEGEIEKIGDSVTKKLDVRVIAATNRNLKSEIEKNQFRQDLYFRLNVFPITVPPLRKRPEDIPLLVEHFVEKFGKKYRKDVKYISDAAMQKMQTYKWPGNIRELENLIERAVILTKGESLKISEFDIPNETSKRLIADTGLSLDAAQRNHILATLEQCRWKIEGENGAAKRLKIKSSTLRDRMKKLNIKRPN
tara:strand:- start:38420 stop:41992 length:3573 start_codon:yes stop_codon:yes gene_type:complete